MATKRVELQSAHHWRCPECGIGNFVVGEPIDLCLEEREEAYREAHGLEPWQSLPDDWEDFEIVWVPAVVACWRCGFQAETNVQRKDSE